MKKSNKVDVDSFALLLNDEQKDYLKNLSENRKIYSSEYMRPKYHFYAAKGKMNDPNGLCFWNGNWHLFYQNDPENRGWWWGHAVSKDLLHWEDLPLAVWAEKEKECWSGMVLIEEERAIAVYYGLNTGIMIATSSDPYLINWTKVNDGEPVIPMPEKGSEYMIFDPCIWKKGDTYCLASGRFSIDQNSKTRVRQIFLFESDTLTDWKYTGKFIENDLFSRSDDDASCPYFLPCENKYLLISFSHHSGPMIMVGNYDDERQKFTLTGGRHLTSTSSFFGGLLAPSAFPESNSSLRLIHNITYYGDEGSPYQIMSLPRTVTLGKSNKNDVLIKEAEEVASLRKEEGHIFKENIFLKANQEYFPTECFGDVIELDLTFEAKNVPLIDIKVMMSDDASEYSSIRIYRQRGNTYLPAFGPGFGYRSAHETVVALDTSYSSAGGNVRVPDEQAFYLAPDEKLTLKIFLDRSVIEVFVNGSVALSARVDPISGKNDRISITSRGEDLNIISLESYHLAL